MLTLRVKIEVSFSVNHGTTEIAVKWKHEGVSE